MQAFTISTEALTSLFATTPSNLPHPTPIRCYSESLADKTIDQVRDIYANYTNPHCTPFNATSTGYGGYDDFRHHDANAASVELKSLLMYGTLAKSNLNSAHASDNETDLCKRWIYNLDYGYESMSSDVSDRFVL